MQNTGILEMQPQVVFGSAEHGIHLSLSQSEPAWVASVVAVLGIFQVSKKFLEAVNRLNCEVYQSELILAFICCLSWQICVVCN